MRRLIAPLLVLACAGTATAQTSQGPLGHIDQAGAQRGFLVYETVCAGCHSLNAVHYRDLASIGLNPDQIAALAPGGDADAVFKAPAAMAMGGAVPPDLSDMVNERPGGADYVYRYLTGYAAAPASVTLLPGRVYNTEYPGNQTAMPPVLHDGAVTYADGTATTTAQEAADVATFLTWAAEPELTARHQIGLRALLFFAFLSIIGLVAKRGAWARTP